MTASLFQKSLKMKKSNACIRIQKELLELQDVAYKEFHTPLIPNVDPNRIIGVRTPILRAYAKNVAKYEECDDFLNALPHFYYEENNLHCALLAIKYKQVKEYIDKLEEFLPYIDNWATCDMVKPSVFKKNPDLVYEYVKKWLKSDCVYTARFGIVTLLSQYLDDNFKPEMLDFVASVKLEDYYAKMAVAWYFSIALVKQYDATIGYFTKPVLDKWIHNKAIQKATESLRITDDMKQYLRTLKIK